EAGVTPVALDRALARIAGAAVDLDAFAGHSLRHLAGEELRHRRLDVVPATAVRIVGGGIGEVPRGFDLGRHPGDLEADRLKVADRPAALFARLRVCDRVLERAAREPHGSGGRVDTRHGQPARGALETGRRVVVVAADQDVRLRDAKVVEGELPGLPAVIA